MDDKKVKTDQSERPWVQEPKEHPLIQFIEDHHYGKVRKKDIPYDVMAAAAKRTADQSFKWTEELKCWKFSGRNTTECSTYEKGHDRDAYLTRIFGNKEWNEFDLHSAVPATMLLLTMGEWVGTSDTVHIRKDIHRSLGIDENDHCSEVAEAIKTVSMRWNFSSGLKRATANFERAHLWTKKTPFSGVDLKGIYDKVSFMRGWTAYHETLTGIKCDNAYSIHKLDKWSKDNALLKYSVFWWESRIENEAAASLRSKGFTVAQNYDCIYSDAPEPVIKSAFDDAAALVRNEYLTETKDESRFNCGFKVSGVYVNLVKSRVTGRPILDTNGCKTDVVDKTDCECVIEAGNGNDNSSGNDCGLCYVTPVDIVKLCDVPLIMHNKQRASHNLTHTFIHELTPPLPQLHQHTHTHTTTTTTTTTTTITPSIQALQQQQRRQRPQSRSNTSSYSVQDTTSFVEWLVCLSSDSDFLYQERYEMDKLIARLYGSIKKSVNACRHKPKESLAKLGVERDRAKVWRVFRGELYVSNRAIQKEVGATKELQKRDLLKMGVQFVKLSDVPINYDEARNEARKRGLIS
jgi:hypothetical protein